MFETMRWPVTVAPSASSTFRIGGAWYSASTSVPPLSGLDSPPPEEPQPDRSTAPAAAASAAAANTPYRRSPRTARRRLPTCVTIMKRNPARGWRRPAGYSVFARKNVVTKKRTATTTVTRSRFFSTMAVDPP
jgi:hypothetical protein